MDKIALLFILTFVSLPTIAQTEFITTWKTDNPGSSNATSITIPTTVGTYDYDVSWKNDGTWELGFTGSATHDYEVAGTYTVAIRGSFPRIFFDSSGDRQKILSIKQWGTNAWSSMNNAFKGCSNLTGNAIDTPNLSEVTDMSGMFAYTSLFNQDINDWDVSNVTTMDLMFAGSKFNGAIGKWNVSNVVTMANMFYNANRFNQNIGDWNVVNVDNMFAMFSFASAFNEELSKWDVSSVINMSSMFAYASSFNQNLGNWHVDNVTSMTNMFQFVTLSTDNYDALLNGWNTRTLQSGVVFNAGNSKYCIGQAARANIISSFGWTISDKGRFCVDHFITTWKTNNLGTSGPTSITIPTLSGESYNYDVDWNNDGTFDDFGVLGDITHNYGVADTYTVAIRGDFPRIYFNNSGDHQKILSIEQWGTYAWSSMNSAFYGCSNLNGNATDIPNLSLVTDMGNMFRDAYAFNGNIRNWNVKNMVDMSYMFSGASAFSKDISTWNVSSVTNMSMMFNDASAFNQNIGGWNVSNVTNMSGMFQRALTFNQDLGNWNVSNVEYMSDMFDGATLSIANYDALLNGWNTLNLHNSVTFSGGNSNYCRGDAARNNMINTFGWTITDGGQDCFDMCEDLTEYTTGGGWSNGLPTPSKKVLFSDDYDTAGNIEACGIEIKAGVTLTVSDGTYIKVENNIVNNGNLIFLSSATGNGELAAMDINSLILGNATVQRYFKDRRSYRMVSSAVTTNSSIHTNWQEGATNETPNPNPGFGTHITGSQTGQNGFDATATGNASMYTVNVATQQFEVIDNTDVDTLTAGKPYLMFVRGDRGIDLTNNVAHDTTVLRARGFLFTGTHTQSFPAGNGAEENFVMFGNPYQSAVDIKAVFANAGSANLNPNHYYVYDPTLAEYGSYVTIDLSLENDGTNSAGSVANKYLQPGQAAQVEVFGASTVVFKESNKSPGHFTNSNRNQISESDMLTVQLYTTENFDNGGPVHDSFAILFDEGNDNGLTSEDAVKPMNFYENLGIDHNGTYLSIERREMPQPAEVYPLYSSGYTQSDYTLKLAVEGLEDTNLYLDDHFTGTSTLLEAGDNFYGFSVDASNPLSKATDRFSIRTEQRLGVDNNNLLSGIRLFPNPLNADTFYINAPQLNGEQLTVSINDLTGRRIFERTLECRDNTIPVPMDADLAYGLYMVTLKHGGETRAYRLIKE